MDESQPDIVEAAIYMVSEGDHGGQYVAACAKDECGYFGKSNTAAVYVPTFLTCHHQVPLEQFYDRPDPIRCYVRRCKCY